MANRMSWIALLTASLLSAWVFAEWRAEPQPDTGAGDEPIEIPSTAPQIPEPNQDFTPVNEFKGTLTRPLFVKGRRQQPEESEATDLGNGNTAPPSAATSMKLSAIFINDTERSALLLPDGASQSERVKVGETVSGWEIVEIKDESVLIRSGGREQTLTLREFGPPGAIPKRPAKPGKQAGKRPDKQPASRGANRTGAAEQTRELRRRAVDRAKRSQRPN